MSTPRDNKLKNIIIIGDRVLIKPKKIAGKTKGGLYLPPGYAEKEELQAGYVVKCGPGYPIATSVEDSGEDWKKMDETPKYIPLQVKAGDNAIFLQKSAIEILFNDEKYYVVPQHAILLLERDEELFT